MKDLDPSLHLITSTEKYFSSIKTRALTVRKLKIPTEDFERGRESITKWVNTTRRRYTVSKAKSETNVHKGNQIPEQDHLSWDSPDATAMFIRVMDF